MLSNIHTKQFLTIDIFRWIKKLSQVIIPGFKKSSTA